MSGSKVVRSRYNVDELAMVPLVKSKSGLDKGMSSSAYTIVTSSGLIPPPSVHKMADLDCMVADYIYFRYGQAVFEGYETAPYLIGASGLGIVRIDQEKDPEQAERYLLQLLLLVNALSGGLKNTG